MNETEKCTEGLITAEKHGLMQQRLYKLLSVKSIMSIMMTAVFCYLAAIGQVTPEQFVTVFMTVVAFYFATQSNQHNKSEVAQNG